ncbi:hypothetical protein BH23THE1_BH23THE1_16970 [soil metagenome]
MILRVTSSILDEIKEIKLKRDGYIHLKRK